MELFKESTEESQSKCKTLVLKARDYDNNLENLLDCIKDLSMAGHSFNVVVDPDEENPKDRTFGIDGDGRDQLIDIKVKQNEDEEIKTQKLDESLGDKSVDEITKLYNELKAKGLSKEEIIKELERLDKLNEELINEADGINKVILKQKLKLEYDTNIDYNLDEDDILYNIDFDGMKFSQDLQVYLKSYNINDEFKEVYNSVTRVESDFDNNELTIYLTLGMKFDTEKLQYVFENFIEEVALEDEQFSGTCNVEVDEFDSDPYESGYDPMNDRIQYSTSKIDEIEVDYSFEINGEQSIKIEQ